MKKSIKRILSLLMSCAMAASMLGTVAFAEKSTDPVYDSEYSYALNYTGNYSANQWQYFSPYMPSWSYDGAFDYNNTIAFTLIDTINAEAFPVYCTDIDTGLEAYSNFRRLNLEDSTYAGAGAGLLRAIMLNGFPTVSVKDLGNAAGVENLTIGEAVTATQTAVWKAAHGNMVEFKDFVYKFDTAWGKDATVHYDECMDEINNGYASSQNETLIEAKIEKVFNYLINLDPMGPQELTVSTASFKEWSKEPALVKNEDGTYNVTVTATVDVTVKEGDSLNLTASVGECSTSAALVDGKNELSLTIANVPADDAYGVVTIAIAGKQTVKDVFLFDAEGNRDASQSLVGILGTQLPVYAEIKVEPERKVIINKVEKVLGEDGKAAAGDPLEGISFDIYEVCTLSDYLNGKITLSSMPTDGKDGEISKYKKDELHRATVTTNEDGVAELNLSKLGLPDGVYMVVEQSHPAVEVPTLPFYVMVPMTNTTGDGWDYEIEVQPKNLLKTEVEIDKDVIKLDNDESSVNAGEAFTWIIRSSIPKDIATGKSYVISDTLDHRLDYVGVTRVAVTDGVNNEVNLAAEDYVVTPGTTEVTVGEGEDAAAYTVDTFTVSLNKSGMAKAAEVFSVNAEVRVYFETKTNENAELAENIPNQATINYTNSFGKEYDDESDIPFVYTGGANLLKVDGTTNVPLEGATFVVYRTATVAEIEAKDAAIEYIDGVTAPVIPVSFYANADLAGDKVTSVTSGKDGTILIYGLAYSSDECTYYLVETKAPATYNILPDPVVLTVDANTHLTESVVTVKNFGGFELPETGGIGTTIYTAMGTLMICAAGAYIILSKKRVVC